MSIIIVKVIIIAIIIIAIIISPLSLYEYTQTVERNACYSHVDAYKLCCSTAIAQLKKRVPASVYMHRAHVHFYTPL